MKHLVVFLCVQILVWGSVIYLYSTALRRNRKASLLDARIEWSGISLPIISLVMFIWTACLLASIALWGV